MQQGQAVREAHPDAERSPFGREFMREDRLSASVVALLGDPETAVAEAVRFIYFTGSPRRRNVRIRPDYATAEYWDGARWWVASLREVVEQMADFAAGELEHCVDWSEALEAGDREASEAYLRRYRADPDAREAVRRQVVAVMIDPTRSK